MHETGHAGSGFGYDNEFPRHAVCLRPFRLAARCVTNREWQAFIAEGVSLITDHPVTGVDSKDSKWGLENCWGE